MNTQTLMQEIEKARNVWLACNALITVNDLLATHGDEKFLADWKVAKAEKALERYERLKRTLDVRMEAAKFKQKYSI